MVKRQKNNTRKNCNRKGFSQNRANARKINASTAYETCTEQLSLFGGLLALIKFIDLLNFHKIFNATGTDFHFVQFFPYIIFGKF